MVLTGTTNHIVGTIPKEPLAAVRGILNKQKPDGESQDWVQLALYWCYDNEAFQWTENGESIVNHRPRE